MFRRQRSFVLRSPATVRYSHERMAKKNAPIASKPIAIARLVDVLLYSVRRIVMGIAF